MVRLELVEYHMQKLQVKKIIEKYPGGTIFFILQHTTPTNSAVPLEPKVFLFLRTTLKIRFFLGVNF